MEKHEWSFDGGLNYKDEPHLLKPNEALILQNCLTTRGSIEAQKGPREAGRTGTTDNGVAYAQSYKNPTTGADVYETATTAWNRLKTAGGTPRDVAGIYKLDNTWLRKGGPCTMIPWRNTVICSRDDGVWETDKITLNQYGTSETFTRANGRLQIWDTTEHRWYDVGITGPGYENLYPEPLTYAGVKPMKADPVTENIVWAYQDAKVDPELYSSDNLASACNSDSPDQTPINRRRTQYPYYYFNVPVFPSTWDWFWTDAGYGNPVPKTNDQAFITDCDSLVLMLPKLTNGIFIDLSQPGSGDWKMQVEFCMSTTVEWNAGNYKWRALSVVNDTSDAMRAAAGLHYISWEMPNPGNWQYIESSEGDKGYVLRIRRMMVKSAYTANKADGATYNIETEKKGGVWARRIFPAMEGVEAAEVQARYALAGKRRFLARYVNDTQGIKSHVGVPGLSSTDLWIECDAGAYSYIDIKDIPNPLCDQAWILDGGEGDMRPLRTYRAFEYPVDRVELYATTLDGTAFYYVTSFAKSTFGTPSSPKQLSYKYTENDADILLNEPLDSDGWHPPYSPSLNMRPEYIHYHNGCFFMTMRSRSGEAAHATSERQLFASYPDNPHAWLLLQNLPFDERIRAFGGVGANLLLITDQRPWIVTGNDPQYLSKYPLMSQKTITHNATLQVTERGAFWVAPDGICHYDGGMTVTDIMTPKWGERDIGESVLEIFTRAAVWRGRYFFFTPFWLSPDADGQFAQHGEIDLRYGIDDVRISMWTPFQDAANSAVIFSTFVDQVSDVLYLGVAYDPTDPLGSGLTNIWTGYVYEWEAGGAAYLPWKYRTGAFNGPPDNLAKDKYMERIEVVFEGKVKFELVIDGVNYKHTAAGTVADPRRPWNLPGIVKTVPASGELTSQGSPDKRTRAVLFFATDSPTGAIEIGREAQLQMSSSDGSGRIYQAHLYYEYLENMRERKLWRMVNVLTYGEAILKLYADGVRDRTWKVPAAGEWQVFFSAAIYGAIPQAQWHDAVGPNQVDATIDYGRNVLSVQFVGESVAELKDRLIYHRAQVSHLQTATAKLYLETTLHRSIALDGNGQSDVFFLPNSKGMTPHIVLHGTTEQDALYALRKVDWISEPEEKWSKRIVPFAVRVQHKATTKGKLWLDGVQVGSDLHLQGQGETDFFFTPNSRGFLPQFEHYGTDGKANDLVVSAVFSTQPEEKFNQEYHVHGFWATTDGEGMFLLYVDGVKVFEDFIGTPKKHNQREYYRIMSGVYGFIVQAQWDYTNIANNSGWMHDVSFDVEKLPLR